MAGTEEIKRILEELLKQEKAAEENCGKLLESLHNNGFSEQVKQIKNDEIRHQQWVKDLLEML